MKDRSSSKIDFKLEVSEHDIFSSLNIQLFGWVIENIMQCYRCLQEKVK